MSGAPESQSTRPRWRAGSGQIVAQSGKRIPRRDLLAPGGVESDAGGEPVERFPFTRRLRPEPFGERRVDGSKSPLGVEPPDETHRRLRL